MMSNYLVAGTRGTSAKGTHMLAAPEGYASPQPPPVLIIPEHAVSFPCGGRRDELQPNPGRRLPSSAQLSVRRVHSVGEAHLHILPCPRRHNPSEPNHGNEIVQSYRQARVPKDSASRFSVASRLSVTLRRRRTLMARIVQLRAGCAWPGCPDPDRKQPD